MTQTTITDTSAETTRPAQTPSSWQLAIDDFVQSLRCWRIWRLIAWQDIRLRYRRSQIGPFWITLSMGITISSMGFLYVRLFKMEIQTYLPYLATGMLAWNFLLSLTTEGTNAFIEAEQYIKQIKLPLCTYLFRTVFRSLIIFAHHIVIMIPLFLWLHIPCTWALLMFPFSLLCICINALCYGCILASLGARYRDILQIVMSIMQIIFFLTPIMWRIEFLSGRYLLWIKLNPFAHLVNVLRYPMMSQMPSLFSLIFVSFFTLVGIGSAFLCLKNVRQRVVYWV
jgi:ABC-type polysaccharide/polyol phosphate export permease